MYEQDTFRRATRGETLSAEAADSMTSQSSSSLDHDIPTVASRVEWWLFGLLGLVAGLMALTAIISWNVSDVDQRGVTTTLETRKIEHKPASAQKKQELFEGSDDIDFTTTQDLKSLQASLDLVVRSSPIELGSDPLSLSPFSAVQVKMIARLLEASPHRSLAIFEESASSSSLTISPAEIVKADLVKLGISPDRLETVRNRSPMGGEPNPTIVLVAE